ncbi:hypothetical protein [Microcystis sp. LE19-59.1C]|uniref:hypothetical protein n=1 Tax=Microcystis sp. LE19-59.1C TaxID=3016442 RepID=UPI00258C6348|nr:hypothetical protein [Microcystis sp. LE19-59.1C]
MIKSQESGDRRQETGDYFYLFFRHPTPHTPHPPPHFPTAPLPHCPTSPLPHLPITHLPRIYELAIIRTDIYHGFFGRNRR